MSVKIEKLNAVLDEMLRVVLNALAPDHTGETLPDIIERESSSFDQFTKEEIVGAFIGFAMNVSVTAVNDKVSVFTEDTNETTPMVTGGQA